MNLDIRAGAVLTLAVALAACSSQDDSVSAENATVEEVGRQVAAADIKPKPGRWESKVEITEIDMPGMPPEVQQMMKAQLGKTQTSFSCLTQEEADAADGEMFKPEDNAGCKYNSFKMGSGKIAADMTCAEGDMAQNMKMSGTYSDEAYEMAMSSQGTTDGKPVSMAMKVASKRVGDCTGKEPS